MTHKYITSSSQTQNHRNNIPHSVILGAFRPQTPDDTSKEMGVLVDNLVLPAYSNPYINMDNR